MENPGSLRERNGAVIELKTPYNSEEVTAERYVHSLDCFSSGCNLFCYVDGITLPLLAGRLRHCC